MHCLRQAGLNSGSNHNITAQRSIGRRYFMKRTIILFSILGLWVISCSTDNNRGETLIQQGTADLREINRVLLEKNDELIVNLNSDSIPLDTIRAIRNNILYKINIFENTLIFGSGGINDYGQLSDPFSPSAVKHIVDNGIASQLQKNVNSLIDKAEALNIDIWTKFLDRNDLDELKSTSSDTLEQITFAHYNFQDKYLFEVIYNLERLKFVVLNQERDFYLDILVKQNGK